MKNLPALAVALLLGMTGLIQSGCVAVVAAGAGAGAVAYVRGELSATLEQPYERVVRSSNAAITTLQFAKVSEKKDALTAVLLARTAEDKRIEIKVSKIGEKLTEVKIRVGMFGDENISRALLDEIRG